MAKWGVSGRKWWTYGGGAVIAIAAAVGVMLTFGTPVEGGCGGEEPQPGDADAVIEELTITVADSGTGEPISINVRLSERGEGHLAGVFSLRDAQYEVAMETDGPGGAVDFRLTQPLTGWQYSLSGADEHWTVAFGRPGAMTELNDMNLDKFDPTADLAQAERVRVIDAATCLDASSTLIRGSTDSQLPESERAYWVGPAIAGGIAVAAVACGRVNVLAPCNVWENCTGCDVIGGVPACETCDGTNTGPHRCALEDPWGPNNMYCRRSVVSCCLRWCCSNITNCVANSCPPPGPTS